MTENIGLLRLEVFSRNHLVHLAQAEPPWAHCPGLCPGAFWSPGDPGDLPDGRTSSWEPRTPRWQQHLAQPQQWVQAPPWATPTLAAARLQLQHFWVVSHQWCCSCSSHSCSNAPWAGEDTITKALWCQAVTTSAVWSTSWGWTRAGCWDKNKAKHWGQVNALIF